jgi:hypothetical protein
VNAGCPAIFARPEAWLFIALAAACSLVILYVAAHATPLARTLVQGATGIVVGMYLQPSTSGIAALVTTVLSLASLPPRRSLVGGLALFVLGMMAGIGARILTSTPGVRC